MGAKDGKNTAKNNPGPKKKKKKLKWVLLGFLLFLLALIVAVFAFVWTSLNKINRPDPNVETLSPEQAATYDFGDDTVSSDQWEDDPDITWPSQSTELIGESDNITNILLIGQDRRPGEVRARSDAMILISVNEDKNKATMVSFLRDNYVQIPGGYRDNRLNAAFAFGGMELLDETLAANFGIKIDYNVEVDFDSFSTVVDLVGGVDLNLTEAEAEYINKSQKTRFTAGTNHLDGEQALCYSRIRKLDSDFGRTNRQRNVLNSLISTAKNLSLTEVLNLTEQVLPMLTTDMSNMEIISCITRFLPIVAGANEITSLSIPGDTDYYYATIRGMMVLVPDLEASRDLLESVLK